MNLAKSEYANLVRMHEKEGTAPPAYVEWLEREFESLTYNHIHPNEEERKVMAGDRAADLVQQQVYDACCLAERFEVPGDKGSFCGNGHHFAQQIGAFAKAEFLRRWYDNEKRAP